ncbi:hypothetical protein I551_5670 [Mycobacterium ulcerans str. Harvey]|uniref:Uncharacterized protein n=1 Tax=Mycobacterium ulcerans str. Harvey TaxID=1299332 RepID=A0ABN0QT32_MYCUL|nr:hypothetical protein I551_5670 [Mycobacterium ulcerans str. Harvey]
MADRDSPHVQVVELMLDQTRLRIGVAIRHRPCRYEFDVEP